MKREFVFVLQVLVCLLCLGGMILFMSKVYTVVHLRAYGPITMPVEGVEFEVPAGVGQAYRAETNVEGTTGITVWGDPRGIQTAVVSKLPSGWCDASSIIPPVRREEGREIWFEFYLEPCGVKAPAP